MAALQAQVLAPQAIVDPRRIAMYAQWYSDISNDPFAKGYASVLQAFAASVDFNSAPATLLEQAIGSMQGLQTYLILTPTIQGGCIFCLNHPAKYTAQLGGTSHTMGQFNICNKGK